MAFKKVMTGGACQPDGTQGGMNQNAFTSLIDQFISSNAMGMQNAEGYQNQMSSQNVQFLEQQYANMMNQDFMQKEFERMRIQETQSIPQQQNYFQHLQNKPNMMQEMNSIWDASVTQTSQAEAQMQMNQEQQLNMGMPQMGMMNFQQPWMNPMMQTPMYQQRQFPQQMQQQQNINEDLKTDVKEPVLIDEYPPAQEDLLKNEIKETTGNMVKVLESSDNPKHRNSKFLKFLKKLEVGYYAIDNDQLVKVADKKDAYKEMEDNRLKEESMKQQEESKEQINTNTDLFKKLWDSDKEVTDDQFDEMMTKWDEEGQDEQFNNLFMKEWGKQWQQEEPEPVTVIPFEANNKYADQDNTLKIAKQLVEEGQSQEAVVCLQAEVTKNPENAEAWRLMGQLYQENDQDELAILAFKKAYEIDPYDLDSLLCLGVSCTNELEQQEAIKHLHSYLKYHPEYSQLPNIQSDNLTLDEVHEAYEKAYQLNSKDSNLCLAMGVLAFIRRQFQEAITHFQNGIRENPTDHTLWNKYGAALANNTDIDQAIQVYQTALDLRPNYVRTLANIGLAMRNRFKFEESVPYFLNALVLNPQAEQVWRYLRSSFLQMNRPDLVEKANFKDANLYRDQYTLIQPGTLPKPNLERVYNHEIWNNQ
eukprot:403342540